MSGEARGGRTNICVVGENEPTEAFARMMRLEWSAKWHGPFENSSAFANSTGVIREALEQWTKERFRAWIIGHVVEEIKLTARQEWEKLFGNETEARMAALLDGVRGLRWKAFTESEWYACTMMPIEWCQVSPVSEKVAMLQEILFDERVRCESVWYKLEYARCALMLPIGKGQVHFPKGQPFSMYTTAHCVPLPNAFGSGTLPLEWRGKFHFRSIRTLRSDEPLPEMFLILQPVEELDSLNKLVAEFNELWRKAIAVRKPVLWGSKPRFPVLLVLTNSTWRDTTTQSTELKHVHWRNAALRILQESTLDSISVCSKIEVIDYCERGATESIDSFKDRLTVIEPGRWTPVSSRFDAAQHEQQKMLLLRSKKALEQNWEFGVQTDPIITPGRAVVMGVPTDPIITPGRAVVMDVPNLLERASNTCDEVALGIQQWSAAAVDEEPAAPAPPRRKEALAPNQQQQVETSTEGPDDCVICLDAKRTRASVQCGHFVLCNSCAVDKCPICNAAVSTWITIYNP